MLVPARTVEVFIFDGEVVDGIPDGDD